MQESGENYILSGKNTKVLKKRKIESEKTRAIESKSKKKRDLCGVNQIDVDMGVAACYNYPCSDFNAELLICKANAKYKIRRKHHVHFYGKQGQH